MFGFLLEKGTTPNFLTWLEDMPTSEGVNSTLTAMVKKSKGVDKQKKEMWQDKLQSSITLDEKIKLAFL